MGWKRWARIARVVVRAVVAGATLMILGLVLTLNGQSEEYAARCGLVAVTKRLPLKDGAFDPYAFLRSGEIPRDYLTVPRSARSKTGPTDVWRRPPGTR